MSATTQPAAKHLTFRAEVPPNGIVKKGCLGQNIQGKLILKSKGHSTDTEVKMVYLNDPFLQRIEHGEELEVEVVIRRGAR